jgi:hypothetical protein
MRDKIKGTLSPLGPPDTSDRRLTNFENYKSNIIIRFFISTDSILTSDLVIPSKLALSSNGFGSIDNTTKFNHFCPKGRNVTPAALAVFSAKMDSVQQTAKTSSSPQ